jgi:hypothetical protein
MFVDLASQYERGASTWEEIETATADLVDEGMFITEDNIPVFVLARKWMFRLVLVAPTYLPRRINRNEPGSTCRYSKK